MDTIAVVGAGDRAIALLARLAESRFELISISTSPERMRIGLRRGLPSAMRASWLSEVRFVSELGELADCSIVVDAHETADESHRARALAAIEAHMSTGAVLASPTADPARIVASLARPTQFVVLEGIDAHPSVIALDDTAPGATFAAERLCAELGPRHARVTATFAVHRVLESA